MAAIVGRVKVNTKGLDELASVPGARGITLKGARAGIKVLIGPARAGAPRRSGALRRAQSYKAKKGTRVKTLSYAVQKANAKFDKQVKVGNTTRRVRPAWYDHLAQGGTKAHKVGNRKHPGSRPNPYRSRAFEAHKDRMGQVAAETMVAEAQRVIDKAAAKVLA